MDAHTERAMMQWPDVPAVFGWLGLDRRGRWLLRGEPVTRPQLVELINRNYAGDGAGRWFFQNGPQRVFVELAYAPWIFRGAGEQLATHTGLPVQRLAAAYLDEEGALLLVSEHGPGLLADADLGWLLDSRLLTAEGRAVDDAHLAAALASPSGSVTRLELRWDGRSLPLARLDAAATPKALGFVRRPEP